MSQQQPFEPRITDEQRKTIARQRVFFVATAGPAGPIMVSPRGHDCLRILDAHRLAWVDYPGSGNETAENLRESDRITLLFCDLEGTAFTVRVFGRGRSVLPGDDEFAALLQEMGIDPEPVIRQVFVVDVQLTSNSCGSGVPVFGFERDGTLLRKWRNVDEAGKLHEAQRRIATPRPGDVLDGSAPDASDDRQ